MKWRIKVISWLWGQLVGTDQFGNQYYQDRLIGGWRSLFLGRKNQPPRRWVLYKGLAEPSKVPPQWHGWLHGTQPHPPEKNEKAYEWQKEHLPNLTGTSHAYSPKPQGQSHPPQDYQPWIPPSPDKES